MRLALTAMTPDSLPDPIAIALDFTRTLERLGIPYVVGGSLASSVHGEPRSTNDIDLVADLSAEQVAPLVQALTPAYYVSTPTLSRAVREATSFNAIHIDSAVKVDVFVAGSDLFEHERIEHRQQVEMSGDQGGSIYFDTPEHSILRKLEWYRRGDEVSERQWRDVVAILRIQSARLDGARLEFWADRLGVSDLLERARAEAAGS